MRHFFLFLFISFCLYSCSKDNSNPSSDSVWLNAIGQFDGPMSCTGTFIEIPNMHLDSSAILITNGHCASVFFKDNDIDYNQPIDATIYFKKRENVPENEIVKVKAKRILYSTMKGTDLAIVELNISNRKLMEQGVYPIKVASTLPNVGTSITTYGYPIALMPIFLRKNESVLGSSSNISEFIWLWKNFYSSKFSNIYSGCSGSPVFTSNSQAVFAIINTTTIGGIGDCELGAPCELRRNDKPIVVGNTSYMLDVTKVARCFVNGVFDINSGSFPYEKPSDFNISLKDNVRNFNNSNISQYLELVIDNSSSTSYKVESYEVFEPSNYNNFIPNNLGVIKIPIPSNEGFYVISVLKNGQFDKIKYLTFKIDFSAPSKDLIHLDTINDIGGFSIQPVFKYPELVQFYWKYGRESACDCNDLNDFNPYNRIPIQVENSQRPYKVCVIGSDLANNKTTPKEFIFK